MSIQCNSTFPPECKVSDDREIEEESGGNKNDQPTIGGRISSMSINWH